MLDPAFQQIVDHLNDWHYPRDTIAMNVKCLSSLDTYLTGNNLCYSPEVAEKWLLSQSNLSQSCFVSFHCALSRLRYVLDPCWIPLELTATAAENYAVLEDSIKHPLDQYLSSLAENKISYHKFHCVRFLAFAQHYLGINRIQDISFEVLALYYEIITQMFHFIHYGLQVIADFLKFLYECGYLPYSAQFLFHFLWRGKGFFWNDITDSAWNLIVSIHEEGTSESSLAFFDNYKLDANKFYNNEGYCKAQRCRNTFYHVHMLSLFLDNNHYGYKPEIAQAWCNGLLLDKITVIGTKRCLCLLQKYYEEARFVNLPALRKKSSFYNIPEWCKEGAFRYVEMKEKEGWERSTMDMIRSSITRFCNVVDSFGVRSYKELNAEHIKRFNTADKHSTPEGKNAYNSRIRKFLYFLGKHEYLSNRMLYLALETVCAPKDTIVVVLTDEEMSDLQLALKTEDSGISLRNKAIVLLGLKMGLRGSDIVNLKYDNVDWENESIRFVQKKTSVEVNLPMPPEVGNALFRYITEERPEKENPSIFLKEKGPYTQVSRIACYRALKKILPNRNVRGSHFHVLRKTFATNLLRNGVPVSTVTDALGQINDNSVHRYLSLDEKHMRMCALSLEECALEGWSHAGL